MIPVYGDSPYLEETLKSIEKNVPSDIPVTVIEDYSEGASKKNVVEKYPRVEYISNNKRLGIARNFNKCFELSRGLYTQIIGSDDIYCISNFTNTFEKIALHNYASTPALIIFDAEIIDSIGGKSFSLIDLVKKLMRPLRQGRLNSHSLLKSILIGQWIYFPATLWQTSYVIKRGFNDEYFTAFDLELLIYTCLTYEEIYYFRESLISYRRHISSQSSKLAKNGLRFKEELAIHKQYSIYFKGKKMYTDYLLSLLAFTVRLNRLWSLLKHRITYKQIF
jgi:glycosyltransferase involved in cell wall biosynthesis